MVLSDKAIRKALKEGHINIDPFVEDNLQPASYDLHMANTLLLFDRGNNSHIDIKKPMESLMVEHKMDKDGYILHPKEFVLGNIKEITGVDDEHVAFLHGKSSLARIGLLIHATAGLLDPGNEMRLTLEMYNLSPLPIKLYPDMKIGQITFERIDGKCDRPYGSEGLNSKYKGDMGVMGSKMYQNYTDEKKQN